MVITDVVYGSVRRCPHCDADISRNSTTAGHRCIFPVHVIVSSKDQTPDK